MEVSSNPHEIAVGGYCGLSVKGNYPTMQKQTCQIKCTLWEIAAAQMKGSLTFSASFNEHILNAVQQNVRLML